MNYINQLQAHNRQLKKELELVENWRMDLISFLHSPKFAGAESDGSRKDWIATGDVLMRLAELRNQLNDSRWEFNEGIAPSS